MKNSMLKKWKSRELYSKLLVPDLFLVRVDGRNFSKILEGFDKPYDLRFARVMVESCREIMKEFNSAFAYTFSDEATFLFRDTFGCRLEKIDSIIASEFASRVSLRLGVPVGFDCRVVFTNIDEIWEYLAWRQDEAWRNHLNSYAFYTLLKEIKDRRMVQRYLEGKKSKELHDILFSKGINPAKTPAWQRRGILIYWKKVELEKEFRGKIVRYKRRRIVEDWEPPLFDSEEGKRLIDSIVREWLS